MADEPMESLALFKMTEEETAQVINEAGGGTVTWAPGPPFISNPPVA
jgi:hypothetical protein